MLWRIEMFGGLRASSGDQTITRFQTYKTGALLAYLAYFPGRLHPREELINILWPDVDPTSARNRLSQALVWLRPRLEQPETARRGVLFTDRHSVGLHQDTVITDISRFDAELQSVSNLPPQKQIDALRRAIDLYRGELLAGFYEDWVFSERQHYSQAFMNALRHLIALYEQEQEYDRALDYARRALTADPLVEEVHRDLIRLLAHNGQPAAALRQYHELEKILADKLGEIPSTETRTLVEQIRSAPTSLSPSTVITRPPNVSRFPASLTRFFGRTEEIAQIHQFIADSQTRLITLIGPGGSGKTRLVTEISSQLNGSYPGNLWFVPLADVHDAHLIPNAIADIIRTPGTVAISMPVQEKEQVIEWLSWRPTLLILDNLEHLIDGTAPLIRELLERVPLLTIMVTSRQRLGVDGEREIAIRPLPTPISQLPADAIGEGVVPALLMGYESIQLFVDRAQAVRPSFCLDEQNAPIIAQICDRLEGLPLATELCAAWAQTLSPSQMLEQLTRPFDLLVSRRREVPARHSSLWAALEYSYQQLTPDQQQFFNNLCVFRSGWTLEAAEAICLEPDIVEVRRRKTRTLDFLTELRERSLITVEEVGPEMRYRMLETLREFAAEQQSLHPELLPSLRRRHAKYYLQIAEAAERYLVGPEQVDRLHRLSAENDNLRAALSWTVETQEAEIGLRLACALTPFWDACGFLGEGQQWLAQVLHMSDENVSSATRETKLARAKALTARGNLARNQGTSPEIDAAMQEAIQLWRECRDERGMAAALQILATITYSRDDGETARDYLQEGLLLARQLHDRSLMAQALHNLGNIGLARGEWVQAHAAYTESLSLYRAEGNRNRAGHILNNIGLIARYQGDYQTALIALHEALETGRELADRSGMALATMNLATINRLEGHFTSASSFLDAAARHAAEAGERRLLPWCVRERGYQYCAQGDYEKGVRLLAAAESQRLSMGIMFKPADPNELERTAAQARVALGELRFAALWAVGSALPRTQVYAEALHLSAPAVQFD